MRVMVIGHKGMLGSRVVAECSRRGHTVLPFPRSIGVEVVINCAGVVPDKAYSMAHMVNTNAAFVWEWHRKYVPNHFVHISTDCVFSGLRRDRSYKVTDIPDPTTVYSISKRAGELTGPNCTVIRTSFVGPEHGLWKWYLDHHEADTLEVQGFKNAWWTGSTVWEVARKVVDIAEEGPQGLVHLSTIVPITKFELLQTLQGWAGHGPKIIPVQDPWINRALEPTRLLAPFYEALWALPRPQVESAA